MRAITIVLAVLLACSGVGASAADSAAATGATADTGSTRTIGCVTRSEFDKVERGMLERAVKRIFDVRRRPVTIYQGGGGLVVGYRTCRRRSFRPCAVVQYDLSPSYVATVYSKQWTTPRHCRPIR